jgi:hypothetical protein
MDVERVWQTSSTMPLPKILVHCIIDDTQLIISRYLPNTCMMLRHSSCRMDKKNRTLKTYLGSFC